VDGTRAARLLWDIHPVQNAVDWAPARQKPERMKQHFLVRRPGLQQLLWELGDRPLRVKVCDQIVIQSLEFRVAQRRDTGTVIAAIALPCIFCHLQNNDGNDRVAAGAVVQD